MKKNHLDFKDLAQSLAMDKGKLERYVTVRLLLKLFNNSESCQIYNRSSDAGLHTWNGSSPKEKNRTSSYGTLEKELFWDIGILQKLLYLSTKPYAFVILV